MAHKKIFNNIAVEWLQDKKNIVKYSTYCTYSLIVHKYLLPYFSKKYFITEKEVQAFVYNQLERGMSNKTIHDVIAVLKSIKNYSSKHYGCSGSDWEIKMPGEKEIPRRPILTLAEHRKLLNYLSINIDKRNIGILIALCTGMRIGEICGLQWKDVNIENKIIIVNKTAGRIYDIEKKQTLCVLTSPKTFSSKREIPINSILLKSLREVRGKDKGVYVVGCGEKPCEPRNYRDYFNRLMQRLGMRKIVFHGLRHTFATRCIESQCDYKKVSALLGHSYVVKI